jgi:hypothetical protein
VPPAESSGGGDEVQAASLPAPNCICACDAQVVVSSSRGGRAAAKFQLAGLQPAGSLPLPHAVSAVACDREGRLFAVCPQESVVCVFERDGSLARTFGGRGSEPGRLLNPYGVAVTAAGLIAVADTANRRVQLFDAAGELHGELRGADGLPAQLRAPLAVAATVDGRVLVSDCNRVLEFGAEGRLIREFVAFSDAATRHGSIVGLAPSPDGLLFACVLPHHVIALDLASGRELARLADCAPVKIRYAAAALAPSPGRLIVCDEGAGAILSFKLRIV